MLLLAITITSLVLLSAQIDAGHEDYRGYKVYSLQFKNEVQQEKLNAFKGDLIEFWRYPNFKRNVAGRVMVPPSQFDWFETQLDALGLEKDIFIEDVYEYLKQNDKNHERTLNYIGSESFTYDRYHRYNHILQHLENLQEAYVNSSINVEIVEHGRTQEDRPLIYVKVSRNDTEQKPIILIESAIIPCEWITVPSSIYILEQILEDEDYLNDFQWLIIPVLNPDGYEYTHTNLRLWLKSLSQNSNLGFICPGVNLNRNFDIDWLISDSSTTPCSHLYGGATPFSESETQMVKNLIDEYGSQLLMYISLQNKDGFVTYPWQYEQAASGMYREQLLLGLEMVNNTDYKLELASVAIQDRISGTSSDYARHRGVWFTYNIEIVGRGDDFMLIPENDIEDIVKDVWQIVAAAADNVLKYV